MGITGLWPILEPCCQPVTLESMEGKKLAVDVSIWIYQAQLGFSAEVRSPHLALLLSRMAKLLFYKIRPVFVFDGPDVPLLKQRVLEERRLKKYEEDRLPNKERRRHLENLAIGCEDEEEVRRWLSDGPRKRQRLGNEAFFNLPTAVAPEITLSDGEEDLVVEKVVEKTVMTKTAEIQQLMDLKEQIRISRLHPDAIPKATDEFCQFQLARVLGKNKLNKTIVKLTQEQQNRYQKADVRLAVADSQGGTHVISYDSYEDCQIVNPEPISARLPDNWESLGLTLDHFQQPSNTSLEQRAEDEEDSFDHTEFAAEMSGREFVGKGTMIENFMKRRIGSSRIAALRQDDWSSDSGDDFIDVSDGEVNLAEKREEDASKKAQEQPNKPSTSGAVVQRQPFVQPQDRDKGDYRDLQEFLTACGFPWIEAPGEAEAQCVELERLGLVEGIVSDDSDVWAFGAQNVYRHLFSKDRNVQYYSHKKIFNKTGLSQPNFIEIAMISGGDYSSGIHGVGVVTAIELLAEFEVQKEPGEERNEVITTIGAVEDWLLAKEAEPNPTRLKIKALVEKNNDMEHLRGICNSVVVDSYLRPNVDSSSEPLRWKSVNVNSLRAVVQDKLGWTEDKFNKRHITSYALVQSAEEQRTTMTKRVAKALARLAKKTNPGPPTVICQTTSEDTAIVSSQRACPQRKPAKRTTRKVAKKTIAAPLKRLELSENSDSDF